MNFEGHTMNNNTKKVRVTDLEAEEMITRGKLKKIKGLTPEERSIIYGEILAQDDITSKLYIFMEDEEKAKCLDTQSAQSA